MTSTVFYVVDMNIKQTIAIVLFSILGGLFVLTPQTAQAAGETYSWHKDADGSSYISGCGGVYGSTPCTQFYDNGTGTYVPSNDRTSVGTMYMNGEACQGDLVATPSADGKTVTVKRTGSVGGSGKQCDGSKLNEIEQGGKQNMQNQQNAPAAKPAPQISDIKSKQACEAAGHQWTSNKPAGYVGPVADDDGTCSAKPAAAAPENSNTVPEGCQSFYDQQYKDECKQYATPASENTGECGKARTNIISCEGEGSAAIGDVLKQAIVVLTTIIGVVATAGIVYAAILYASAQDNAGQVSKAKTIIMDVAIGLFLYGFMIVIINWLVPGGVIS